ncbi:Fc.00g064840.m01.CDS01 [Cosmosporella sp. VM-42]
MSMMMPSYKRIHDGQRRLVANAHAHTHAPIYTPSTSTASATLVWTSYVWRLVVTMLAPSTALLPLGAWAASVWGSPVPEIEFPSSYDQHQIDLHDAGFHCFNPSLPNITIYATGGTIAGSASSADQTTGYQVGTVGIQTLIDAVPQLCNVSNVRGVQIASEDSININSRVLVSLAQTIQEDLDSPFTQGAVVTHGTDTMEESAFFLDLTVKSEKPVIVTGAMRPATAISADGPMNLLSSVILAGSEKAKGRGAMIVLNDRIGSARFTTKSNANQLDTFKASDEGFLGVFENVQPVFFYPPSRPLGHHHFDISRSSPDDKLPQVDVLYGHQEFNVDLFKSAVNLGAKGIVLAGLGAGFWPSAATEEIKKTLASTDIPVIVSRRPAWGFVGTPEIGFGIGGGFLNPQKARIQLQLSLEMGLDNETIKGIFEHTGVH